ncbi:sensor histidine kinase [Corynebacterium kroppenstedtii]|uniref:sensor histidine kinase n=1 Tax=Corynebacterium sp. PCR 32 TaxID=3351342 RepID=UPI0030AE726E
MTSRHHRTWRNESLLYPALWLLYLGFPLTTALTSPASTPARLGTIIVILLFATTYLAIYWFATFFRTGHHNLRLWAATAVLTALTAAACPVIGIVAVCFAPYFCALWIFIRSGRRGTITGILTSIMIGALIIVSSKDLQTYLFPAMTSIGITVMIIVGIGIATENRERRRDLEYRLDHARQREAIATTMHDVLSHSLTVIAVKAQLASRLAAADPTTASTHIDDIYNLSHSALNDMRAALDELSPPSLHDAINESRAVCTSAGITMTATTDTTIPPATGALYAAIITEATTNILRHSHATTASITATPDSLTITDNGDGFDSTHPTHGGHGINGMTRRAQNNNASATIYSRPHEGTTVVITMTPDTTPPTTHITPDKQP